jgi:phage terminase small subunit
MKKLNNQEQRFVNEYLIDLDVQRAAIAAGYSKTMATSKAYLWVSNGKNNKKPHVYQAIVKRLNVINKGLEVTQERVLKEYARIGFLDTRKLYDEEGQLKSIHELDDDTAAAVAGIEIDEIKAGHAIKAKTKRVKLADKKGALDSMARHLSMFNDKIEVTLPKVIRKDLTGKDGE